MSEGRAPGYLLDVSRLVWRSWRGRLPTGIDRVCLAYLDRFGARSRLVIQRRGRVFVLSRKSSDRLRRLLLGHAAPGQLALLRVLVPALATARRRPPHAGMLYLNVGHTGLDEATMPAWIARQRVKAVYLIHDLIPVTHPQYCRPGEATKHERRMTNALASAAGIIANSGVTLDELARFASARDMKMPPCLTAWLGIDAPVYRSLGQAGRRRPYFIAVGTIEARKNHLLLLVIWRALTDELGERAPDLVIVGGRGWEAEDVFARLEALGPLKDHVHEISGCADEQLKGLIAGARALLMPSFVEGFGLPVMEALALGTPVIASDLPVYREIVGDIPTYLDPEDKSSWHATIRAFTKDGRERERQLQAIAGYESPSWEEHFITVERWLETIEA